MLSPTCDSDGEVEHAHPTALRQHRVERGGIGEVGDDQPAPARHRRAMAGAQVVDHGDLVTPVHQGGNQMAADITGPAGDQKSLCHRDLSPEIRLVAAVIYPRISVAGTKMHARIDPCQHGSDNLGVGVAQHLQRVQQAFWSGSSASARTSA